MESNIWIKITAEPTNLNFTTQVSLNGDRWDVMFGNGFIKATSHKTYPIPGRGFDERDDAIKNAMNQIVGHLRNLGYFSISLQIKWGYEGGYTGASFGELGSIFPSIHQNGSSTFHQNSMDRAERIIKDVGSSRKKGLKSMLNYWRRAKELDKLGYDSEAFLNYFKILECLAELYTDESAKQAIVDRFCPKGVPQISLCKRYGKTDKKDKENLKRQINFTAKALSAAGISPRLSRGLFIKILDCVFMRHGWNVAHKLVRPNPYDSYGAIGQHSDEFNLVMLENLYISRITKLMILLYVKPKQYKFHMSGNMPIVVPINGKGSNVDD
jgi:hypothetical protein